MKPILICALSLLFAGMQAKGIACDEYTAVCLDEQGIARVFGGHPQYNDNVYFFKPTAPWTCLSPKIAYPINLYNGTGRVKL